MKRLLDLSQLSVAQLKAVRNVLTGTVATAETKKAKRLRESEAEVIRLNKVKERREVAESAGLDWDEPYFMSLSDESFLKTIQLFVLTMKEATAEVSLRTTFNIPPIRGRDDEFEGSEYIAEQLRLRKNGDRDGAN